MMNVTMKMMTKMVNGEMMMNDQEIMEIAEKYGRAHEGAMERGDFYIEAEDVIAFTRDVLSKQVHETNEISLSGGGFNTQLPEIVQANMARQKACPRQFYYKYSEEAKMKEEEFELRETKKEPSLGKALEAFRVCEEVTKEELGEKVGITANLIDLMEKDKIIPSFDMLKCIVTALDYGVELFTPHYLESLRLTSLEVTTHYNASTPTETNMNDNTNDNMDDNMSEEVDWDEQEEIYPGGVYHPYLPTSY